MSKRLPSPPETHYAIAPLAWVDQENLSRAKTPFGDFTVYIDPLARICRVRFWGGLVATPIELTEAKRAAYTMWRSLLLQCLIPLTDVPSKAIPEAPEVDLNSSASEV